MRGTLYITFMASVLALFAWAGCDMFGGGEAELSLSSRTTADLDRAMTNWNRVFGESGISFDGWSLQSTVTPKNRDRLAARLTDAKNVWVPTGTASEPNRLQAVRLSDASDVDPRDLDLFLKGIESELIFGRILAEIRWSRNGDSFTTMAILDEDDFVADLDSVALASRDDSIDDDGLVYDPMLSNVFQVREDIVLIDAESEDSARVVSFGWIWEDEGAFSLGQALTAVLPGCFLGNLLSCGHEARLDLSSFDRRGVNASWGGGPDEEGCSIRYLQGFATGMRQVRVNGDSTEVMVDAQPGMYWRAKGENVKNCS